LNVYGGEIIARSAANNIVDIYTDADHAQITLESGGGVLARLRPTGTGSYFFDTADEKASGYLFESRNNGTRKFGVGFSGTIEVASSPPANASATGVAGTVTWDADYVYVCVSTDTWKRSALSTWP
jgi:hypothetical protein